MEKLIYVITNQNTGRKYVGCTERQAKWRVAEHMKLLKHHRYNNPEMQRDYDQHGESSFSYEVVATMLDPREAMERLWMVKLKTYDERYGYNFMDGAMRSIRREHGLPVPLTKRQKQKIRNSANCWD